MNRQGHQQIPSRLHRMSRPHTVRNLTLAFLGGCLMTYLCMHLKTRLDSSRLGRKGLTLPEQQPVEDASLPASLGLSPMALSQQTGSAAAAPDRLIVAVRHGEVWTRVSCALRACLRDLLARTCRGTWIAHVHVLRGPSDYCTVELSFAHPTRVEAARLASNASHTCARYSGRLIGTSHHKLQASMTGCSPAACSGCRAGHLLAGRAPVGHPARGVPQCRPQGHPGRAAQDPGEQGERGHGLPAVHCRLLRSPARQHRLHPRPQVRCGSCRAPCRASCQAWGTAGVDVGKQALMASTHSAWLRRCAAFAHQQHLRGSPMQSLLLCQLAGHWPRKAVLARRVLTCSQPRSRMPAQRMLTRW